MEGIRRNLEKSCLDLIDFLSASDSIDGVSVISDYELNRATNYGVPDRLDVIVADRGDADRNPISLLLSARRPLIPFRGLVRRWPFTTTREEFAS